MRVFFGTACQVIPFVLDGNVMSRASKRARAAGRERAAAERRARLASVVGGRVKELRQARGLTLHEAAEVTGVERAQLCRLENGHWGATGPGIHTLVRVAEGFVVPVSSLLLGLET